MTRTGARKPRKTRRRTARKAARAQDAGKRPRRAGAAGRGAHAALKHALAEALEQQAATADILQVISSSSGELAPVFQAILENATRICAAKFGSLVLLEGKTYRRAALHNAPAAFVDEQAQNPLLPLTASPTLDRVAKIRQVMHIPDILVEQPDEAIGRLGGARTVLCVPMLKDDRVVGVVSIYRQEVRPFTDKQIELVKNFAAQAVIALENARLFSELRQRTDDLSEALEQQTATADVLKVISRSTFDLQAVLNTLVESAVRLCRADRAAIRLAKDDRYHYVASYGFVPAHSERMRREPVRAGHDSVVGRVALQRKTLHLIDGQADPDPKVARRSRSGATRSMLGVPLLREGTPIGVLLLQRGTVQPFTDKQIELAETFADQAVIAIENVRLFDELQARTDDLADSLQQQTATADVLKVISRSTFDLQTVLGTLVQSAAMLCEADTGIIRRREGDAYPLVATFGLTDQQREHFVSYSTRPDRESAFGRTILERRTVHIPDVLADPEYNRPRLQDFVSVRAALGVPLMREGIVIGVFTLLRRKPRAFTDKQIELVTTFADQAVIAIENVRLFDELQARTDDLAESLQQQTATADVLKVISRSTFDLPTVLKTLVESAARLCGADKAQILRPTGTDASVFSAASYGHTPEFDEHMKTLTFAPGRAGVVGRVLLAGKAVQIDDVLADSEYSLFKTQKLGGFRTHLGVPLLREGRPIGLIVLSRTTVQPFDDKQIELATTFADQAVIAIENVRLFDEIQDKSRQLEEASRHKSQFLANMSHELRTPLNAILGYTELIMDGLYGATPDKMRDVLDRIQRNGKHLLGLINDVLDLSKIEAGQLVLALTDYSLKEVVQSVYSAVEPLAAEKKLAFKVELAANLPAGRGDERRLTQVLLNLVGNAIKFTDRGEVAIKAAAQNGSFTVAVSDTGPGIAEADCDKIFEEFRQADSSITRKKGGTGLGLSISRRIIELHGGRLWVESEIGRGSTFSFSFPVTVERQAGAS